MSFGLHGFTISAPVLILLDFRQLLLRNGKISSIKDYWSQLTSIGPKYGYFPKASKSYLTVNEDQLPNATRLFDNSNVNITVKGKRHLGAIVGSEIYKCEYINDLVKDWNSQPSSTIAESQPHECSIFGIREWL